MKIAYLDITDWSVSVGGRHYTGRLTVDGFPTVEVSRPLTAKETLELNKHDNYISYEPGDFSRKYDSEEQLISSAGQMFHKHYKGIILRGCGLPSEVLVWSPELHEYVHHMNLLYTEIERLGGFWFHPPTVKITDGLIKVWMDLLDRIKLL